MVVLSALEDDCPFYETPRPYSSLNISALAGSLALSTFYIYRASRIARCCSTLPNIQGFKYSQFVLLNNADRCQIRPQEMEIYPMAFGDWKLHL